MTCRKQDILPSVFGSWQIPVALALIEGLTHFGTWHGDSHAYVSMVKLFRGTANIEEAWVIGWHGILRPVVPFLAIPLSYVMSYRDAIAFVNVGFFLLGTFFTYQFTRKLLSRDAAFASAICFASAAPSLIFGTAILTDGPGYAMQIILLYFLLFVFEEKMDLRTSLWAGILIAIAMLIKETSIIILIFLLVRFILHRDRIRIQNLLLTGIVGIVIPMAWAQLVGNSYFQFYGEGLAYVTPGYKGALIHPTTFLFSFVYAFYLCLPFAFSGFFTIDDDKFKTVCEILVSVGILLVLWPTGPEIRFTFLTFPAVLPLAGLGMGQISQILGRRPWFKILSQKWWLMLILLATVAYTNARVLIRAFVIG